MKRRAKRKRFMWLCKPYSVKRSDRRYPWTECHHTGDYCRDNRLRVQVVA